MAENLRSKTLYKVELYLVKVIPIVIAVCYFLNIALSYFYIDVTILSYISGVSLLEIIFLYVSSVVFQFCKYHRMFIHYIAVNWLLTIIDYHFGIPISDRGLFITYLSITGATLFAVIYFKLHHE